jgi:hypothetical protein
MNAVGSARMHPKDTKREKQNEGLTRTLRFLPFSEFFVSFVSLWFLAFPPGGLTASAAQTAWPRINQVAPIGAQRGTTVELTVTGINVGRGTGLLFEGTGLTVESVKPVPPEPPPPPKDGKKPADRPKNPEGKLTARVRIAPDAEPGIRALRVLTPLGPSDIGWFAIGQWPEVAEREPNNTRDGAQEIHFPVTVTGRIDPAEDFDYFRFHAQAGQTLVFEVLAARLESPLDSFLSLQDAGGHEIIVNDDFNGKDSFLACTIPTSGDYYLVLRDLSNRGGERQFYRLSMGEIPYVTAAFPMGGRPGATVPMELQGFNLGDVRTAQIRLPDDAPPGLVPMSVALPKGTSNSLTLAVVDKETPAVELREIESNDDPAKAQRLTVPSIVNGRIQPAGAAAGPDVDCYRFAATKGQKLVLEVIARRYGSDLDSLLSVVDGNGKELASNDDAVGKDSRLEFTAPENGEYVARITDLQDRGGPGYTYRFSLSNALPDFALSFTPDRLAIGQGGRIPVTVTAQRLGGFEGEIVVEVSGLPQGVSVVGPARIRAKQTQALITLTAASDAPIQSTPFRVTGSATVDGKTIRRVAQGMEELVRNNEKSERPVKLVTAAVSEPPDMVVTASIDKLTLAPGKSVEIPVKVVRKEGYKGKVSLTVLGLPDGITVTASDIADSGSEGKITLKAEEKATPAEMEILVAGKTVIDDQRQVLHVAAPLVLTVVATLKKG